MEADVLRFVQFDKLISTGAGGTTNETSFEPIILRGFNGLTDASDTIDQEGDITRRVGKIIIDGTVNLNKSGTQFDGVTRLYANQLNLGAKYKGIPGAVVNAVSEFGDYVDSANINVANTYRVYDATNGSVLFVLDDSITGLNKDSAISEYKTWLSNNNIIIYYQLDVPYFQTEKVEMELPSISRNGSLNTNSVIHPKITTTTGVNREILKKDINDLILKNDPRLKRFSSYFESPLLPMGEPTRNTDVYALYDELMTTSNGYITKYSLGFDSTGLELVSYNFAKPNMENPSGLVKKKIGIIAGLHGNERNPVVGLYNFMKNLTINEYDNEVLDRIKSNIDFYIIPIGCPYGWNNNTRFNANEVNINRNFDTVYWRAEEQNPGSSPASELETQYIQKWMSDNELDYFIDYHVANMGTSETENTLSWFSASETDTEMRLSYFRALSLLSMLWSKRYSYFPQNLIFGYSNTFSNLTQSHIYADSIGIKSGLLEITHYIRYTKDEMYLLGNTWAAEMIGNFLIELTRKHVY